MTAIIVDEVTMERVVTDLQMTEEDPIQLYAKLEGDCSD
jgi:hypothetical protein